MAAKKKPTTSRVSPSKRGEGSKAKPKTSTVSPKARGENKTNLKGYKAGKLKNAKVEEAGLGAVIRGAAALAKAVSKKGGKAGKGAKSANNMTPTRRTFLANDREKVMEHMERSKRVREAKELAQRKSYEKARSDAEAYKRSQPYKPRRSGTPLGPPR